MNAESVTQYILANYELVDTGEADNNLFFFYDGERNFPFATLMVNDVNDSFSNLDRPGVFRLNLGVSKQTFQELVGQYNEEADRDTYDFTQFDLVMPHPVYGKMYWLCIVNPSEETFHSQVIGLISEAYTNFVERAQKKAAKRQS